jgi:hypothetical protein
VPTIRGVINPAKLAHLLAHPAAGNPGTVLTMAVPPPRFNPRPG